MTRKDFELIADWAKANKLSVKKIDSLMKVLKTTNKLFNADKFWERARNG